MADANEAPAPTPKRGLPAWKKALFGLLVALLFFGVLELALALFGVKPLLYEDDPYAGFAGQVPLFVEGGDQMVTADNKFKWFNEQSFPRSKAKGTKRVFCMGGSTTYGRPYLDPTSFCGWLREFLPAADPAQRWELINAGGISYASYRVAALMEELAEHDPDLFIIYSGHNEFLENRTYGELMEMPSAIRGLQATLSKSRTYSLLSRMIKGGGKRGNGDGEELSAEVDTILDNSVGREDYTRDAEWKAGVLSHYRFNLARMVDIARAGGAEVIFVMPASNLRNSSPFKSENREGITAAERGRWGAQRLAAQKAHAAGEQEAALVAVDAALAIDAEHADTHYLRGRILEALGRFPEAKAAYELALENDICPLRMLVEMRGILREVAEERGVPLVDFDAMMAAAADNGIPGEGEFLDHVHPTIESHRQLALALVDALAGAGLAELSGDWGESAIDAVTARVMAGVDDNRRGIALRNLANVLQWAGKYEDAYGAAKKSLELTPSDAYANFVAGDLAEKLGKADEAVERYRFLIGFEVDIGDAPYYLEAHYKLAGLLADRGEYAECVRMLNKTLELKPGHAGAAEALPLALQEWGLKRLQEGDGKGALDPLGQLAGRKPGDPQVANWFGVALIQAGRPAEAIPQLQKVLAANPSNPAVHNNLATAHAQLGEAEKAAQHFKETVRLAPDHLGATANLGELYFEAGQLAEAERYFRRTLQLHPGHPAATERLREIAARKTPVPEE